VDKRSLAYARDFGARLGPRKRLNLASWNRNGRERNYRVSGVVSLFIRLNVERILNPGRRVVKPFEMRGGSALELRAARLCYNPNVLTGGAIV